VMSITSVSPPVDTRSSVVHTVIPTVWRVDRRMDD
jgi:hypothetical protein